MVAPRHWFQRYVRDTDFLQRYPFYAGVLAQLEFVSSTIVPVMGVRWHDSSYQLLVNEAFFERRTRFAAGVLLHEVHHLVLGHLARRTYFDVARPDLMQLAMEVSANEYIAEPLPDPIVWQDFRAHGVAPHQSTMHRYERLVAADHSGTKFLRLPTGFDDHGGANQGQPRHGGDTQIGIGIDDVLRGVALPAGAAARLHVVLRRARTIGNSAKTAIAASQPKPGPKRSRGGSLAASVRQLLENDLAPDGLLGRDVDAVIGEFAPAPGPGRIDWRTALRAFVGRAPRRDWQKPDRRQPHRMLEVPGRTWHGSRPSLLVAIDSSGSMGPAELSAIARELKPLAAAATITIVECDDAVRRVYPFAGRLDEVHGRGGTDLRPPFDPALVRKHGRDGVVYFTDGQGPCPDLPPPVPVLWVLTGCDSFECAFGRRVRLDGVAWDDDDGGTGDCPF